MLINVTIQTFMSENELELSDKRWTDVKDEYLPTLYELGLERNTTTRIWNKSDKHQLGHIFEYRAIGVCRFRAMLHQNNVAVVLDKSAQASEA